MVLIEAFLIAQPPKVDSFRPLAGIMVLIDERSWLPVVQQTWFPSPCGDYGSYLKSLDIFFLLSIGGFRPLAGIMVLIREKNYKILKVTIYSFRPLAGIMVLIHLKKPY